MSENEAAYRSMKFSAVVNIVMGVIVMLTGITGGILLFISAGKLLNGKSRIIF
ncbi:MAG: hypothetical protein K5989_04785 [Lachnospiraceae bacterium]|nr:hypothetical protein [Lachnospiraceae bacterium]